MKILIEFELEGNNQQLDELLSCINNMDAELNYSWTAKKYPKRYKKVVEGWV